jgi:hypothetical protein
MAGRASDCVISDISPAAHLNLSFIQITKKNYWEIDSMSPYRTCRCHRGLVRVWWREDEGWKTRIACRMSFPHFIASYTEKCMRMRNPSAFFPNSRSNSEKDMQVKECNRLQMFTQVNLFSRKSWSQFHAHLITGLILHRSVLFLVLGKYNILMCSSLIGYGELDLEPQFYSLSRISYAWQKS